LKSEIYKHQSQPLNKFTSLKKKSYMPLIEELSHKCASGVSHCPDGAEATGMDGNS
jgi:hypothetical protein